MTADETAPTGRAGITPSRGAGLLLHPTCLPGAGPIGDLGPAAHDLLDWLLEAGLSHWQVLPLGPTGFGDSPYGSLSSFAGNPLLISADALVADGLLERDEIEALAAIAPGAVDFRAAREQKAGLHRKGWRRFRSSGAGATAGSRLPSRSPHLFSHWSSFREAPENRTWLDDWTLFAALKERHSGRAWLDWDSELRDREPAALDRARRQLAPEIEFHAFEQFLFDRQWSALRAAADERGIRLIGDLPFYPALDSADVWAGRELFELDRGGRPRAVAGVPPDYFSATGQLWGNPVYRWRRHADQGFAWWRARVASQLRRVHLLRLDHFRGFVAWWRVPAGADTAASGGWRRGPGRHLFAALRDALGPLPLIAEDLGLTDPAVERLRRRLGTPGMHVLQFAFDEHDSSHAPHRHAADAVVYTGTHDNDTCRGWFTGANEETRRRALTYLGATEEGLPWAMVRAAVTSPAALAVLPLQDLLGLGSAARLNRPGRVAGNWLWRVGADPIPDDLPGRVGDLLAAGARLPAAASAGDPGQDGAGRR